MRNLVRLKAPKDCVTLMIEDVAYTVGEDGFVDVEPAHADKLYLHGFMQVHEADALTTASEASQLIAPVEDNAIRPVIDTQTSNLAAAKAVDNKLVQKQQGKK